MAIYPNPATGAAVNILPPAYEGVSDVRVRLFTTAFRQIGDTTFPGVPPGAAVAVALADRWGTPLADGLYYVSVTTKRGRAMGRLLILR